MSQLPSQEDDHNQGAMSKNNIIRCWLRCMRRYCSCLPCTGLNVTFSPQSLHVYRKREICGSVEKYICLQLYHFRFVAAETLHEGCGGAGLVGSGRPGGGGGQADIRAQGDFGGQTSNQPTTTTSSKQVCIFLLFPLNQYI